jgi:hypothetical protein
MRTIHLNTGWTCEYFEIDPDLYEFQDTRAQVARLSDWRFAPRFAEGWAVWIERRFHLSPQAECVRYHLMIDDVPAQAQLSINGHNLGAIIASTPIDITDWVRLDENRIAFRVESGAAGAFGALRLQAVPCQDV